MGRPKGSKNKSGAAGTGGVNLTGATGTNGGMMSGSRLFNFGAASVGMNKTGDYNVTQSPSMFYSPELTTESWLLPKSRQEILKWVRIFFNLEPYIQAIIMMHSRYPLSNFEIVTPDKSITEFYTEMAFNKDFDLYGFMNEASLSYQKFGEAICFGNMERGKDKFYRWTKFVLLEPELIEIKTDMFSGGKTFELIPTDELKNLVSSTKPEDAERKKQLAEEAPEIMAAINEKRNIKLSEEAVSQIARITDPSATRGTSQIQSCFKVLIYQDWIRLAQSAFAQRYIFPIELWTIGDLERNIIPTADDLDRFRTIITQAVQQPPFSLVFPPTVHYEPLSTLGKQFPINNEYEYIQDQLMVALGVNKNLILGEGPSFSNLKGMALQTLMKRYKGDREKFEKWMINHFFRPIAEKNGFFTTVAGKKKLVLPEIVWHQSLDIEEQEQERQQMIELHDKGYLSTETLYTKFPSLDYATEQKRLEMEKGTIWDKGDDRLPGKINKSLTKGLGGGGGGVGGGGAAGAEAPEPIEPVEPGTAGEPGEGGGTPGETNIAPGEPGAGAGGGSQAPGLGAPNSGGPAAPSAAPGGGTGTPAL